MYIAALGHRFSVDRQPALDLQYMRFRLPIPLIVVLTTAPRACTYRLPLICGRLHHRVQRPSAGLTHHYLSFQHSMLISFMQGTRFTQAKGTISIPADFL